MFVEFESLPDHSRVWIYQSDSHLSDEMVSKIEEKLTSFFSTWESHGKELKGSGKVFYNRFIVLAADQEIVPPTGCSIDKSVAFIKEVESEFSLILFNRVNIAIKKDKEIELIPVSEIKHLLNEGDLNSETLMFNNSIETKAQMEFNWIIPISKSWLGRFVPVQL